MPRSSSPRIQDLRRYDDSDSDEEYDRRRGRRAPRRHSSYDDNDDEERVPQIALSVEDDGHDDGHPDEKTPSIFSPACWQQTWPFTHRTYKFKARYIEEHKGKCCTEIENITYARIEDVDYRQSCCDWLFCTGTIIIHADDTSSRIKNKQSKGRGTREHRALDGEMKLVGLPNAAQTYEHIVRLKSAKNDGGSYRDGGSSRHDYSTSDSD